MTQLQPEKTHIPFRPAELRILRKRPRLAASRWAEQERELKKGPAPGPWKNSRNPAMAGLMDLLCAPSLRILVICKGVQTGASEGVDCFLGREADYSNGSDSALLVLADEKSVKKRSENRIRQMFEQSSSLSQLLSPNPDDTTIYRIRLITGFSLEIGWATSETSLASESYRIVVMDERDKYRSELNAKEAEARTNTYEDRGKKIVKLSNPGEEGGPLDKDFQDCDVIIDYQPVCPDCGGRHVMQWDNFRWPGQVDMLTGEVTADPKRIRRERSAWYQCPLCNSRWDDIKRIKALQLVMEIKVNDWCPGGWVPRTEIDHPYAVGAWFPSWISGLIESQSVIVAEWLEAQDNPDLLRAWYNKRAGLPWSQVSHDEMTEAQTLYNRRYQWRPDGATWIVPQQAVLLIGSVDVQDNRLEAKIIALAHGFQTWIIDRHIIPGSPSSEGTLEQLDEYLGRSWEHESGARLSPAAVGVDTGGHFTRLLYTWLRKRLGRRVFGVKGSSDYRAPLVRMSFPSKKQRRAVPILMINTCIVKNDIHAAYKQDEPGPGYIHFPDYLELSYFEQLTAEKPVDQRDKRGNKVRYWLKKRPSARNEALDLLVYAYAVTHYINPDWEVLERRLGDMSRKQRIEKADSIETIEKPESQPLPKPRPKRTGGFVKNWR